MKEFRYNLWGLLWCSNEKVSFDYRPGHLINKECIPVMFLTRRQARAYADKKYGYIKTRKDLRCYPHGWRMPKPVRITGILTQPKP